MVGVGEPFTLRVEGLINPFFEPGSAVEVWLALPESTSLLSFRADTGLQQSFGGPIYTWNVNPQQGNVVEGELGIFSQSAPPGSNGITNYCLGNGFCASLTADIQLEANLPGTLNFDFSTVSFFGATAGQGTQVTVVPEPESALLLGLGLGSLALARHRSRRRRGDLAPGFRARAPPD